MSDIVGLFKKVMKAKPARPRQGMVLTLEMGARRIKMALLNHHNGELTLHRFGWRDGSNENPGQTTRALRELVEELDPPNLQVATSITGPSVAVRYIQLPKMTPEEVKNAVRYEAEKYIPFKLDEVILDSQILAVEGTKSRVLLVAAKRQEVVKRIQLLKEAGLEPVLVDVDAFCLVNAFLKNYGAPKGVVALLHIGAAYTNINVMQDGALTFTRAIPMAGNHATRVIAERLGVNPAEAERIKVEPGKRQEEIREAQRPFFENFLKEIRLTFDYYENQFEKPINQVRLSGGSSVSAGLIQTLDEGFHLEMSNWTPFEKVGVSQALDRGRVDAWAGSLGVCVGLSLRGI